MTILGCFAYYPSIIGKDEYLGNGGEKPRGISPRDSKKVYGGKVNSVYFI